MSLSEGNGITPQVITGGHDDLPEMLANALALIEQAETIVVSAHHGPDGDALGSTLALTQALLQFGKKAFAFNRDPAPYNLSYLYGAGSLLRSPEDFPEPLDLFIVCDCTSLDRVDPRLELDRKHTKVLCIDHHATIDSDFSDVLVHDVGACATGELVYRLIVKLGIPLIKPVAEALFAAIHTDTGSFRYSNTSPAALSAAGELVRAGVDVWHVCSETYENYPIGRVKLLSEVLDTLTVSDCGRFAFLTVTQDMFARTETGPEVIDGFINYARGVQGVEVAAQVREVAPERYRISLRSRGRVDVATLAAGFGGGGHRNAAGCGLDGNAESVIQTITQAFQEILDRDVQ